MHKPLHAGHAASDTSGILNLNRNNSCLALCAGRDLCNICPSPTKWTVWKETKHRGCKKTSSTNPQIWYCFVMWLYAIFLLKHIQPPLPMPTTFCDVPGPKRQKSAKALPQHLERWNWRDIKYTAGSQHEINGFRHSGDEQSSIDSHSWKTTTKTTNNTQKKPIHKWGKHTHTYVMFVYFCGVLERKLPSRVLWHPYGAISQILRILRYSSYLLFARCVMAVYLQFWYPATCWE